MITIRTSMPIYFLATILMISCSQKAENLGPKGETASGTSVKATVASTELTPVASAKSSGSHPLSDQDFTFNLDGRNLPVFASLDQIVAEFPDLDQTERDTFETHPIANVGALGLQNSNYENGKIRFTFFNFRHSEMNAFCQLKEETATFRGVKVGDPYRKVFEKYGTNERIDKLLEVNAADALTNDELTIDYKYFRYGAPEGTPYAAYDRIEFYIKKGVVADINFMQRIDDGP